ncbi:MAG: cytochrome C biogenesis protein CcdA [Rhodobacterales bacterium]|nr:cytochrome C biogenesis protein CcdA [Rhodobacterales bacterium]
MINHQKLREIFLNVAIGVLSFVFFSTPGYAVEPDEVLENSNLELRARNLSKELRCLVCRNESIDESNSIIARDLRLLLRDRLEAGDSDKEILNFLVGRYGEYILLKPVLDGKNIFLWFVGPFVFVICLVGLLSSFISGATLGKKPKRTLTSNKNK